ncbi:HNH endonuclease [Aetokthonos hydrillicola]
MDDIISLSNSGKNDISNLQPLCSEIIYKVNIKAL